MMKLFQKRSFFLTFLVLGSLSLSGCGFKKNTAVETYSVSLEIWGVFDDTDAYGKAITAYREMNPYVKNIEYRKLSPETYKEDLINALAAGKGPDIFMVRNAWRSSFEDKTAPAPDALFSEREYRNALVDVAAEDFIGTDNKIYGIPTSVDSLALYYNKDIFNAAGISNPPKTWDELVTIARKLNTIDQFGNITRSGVALGTGENINRSSDILMLLLLQMSETMRNRSPDAPVGFSDEVSRQALDFYTQFSRIGSLNYSWNARQHYSIDAFYEGSLAMMINYSWQYEAIKQKNAKLNIGIAPLPQFAGTEPINIANYWGYAVAKNRPIKSPVGSNTPPVNPEKQNQLQVFEAWQFLKFLAMPHENKTVTLVNALSGTTREFPLTSDPTEVYLEVTGKPAARRDLLAKQQDDLILSPFAYGNLIARNWHQGNPEAVDGILIDMIDSVVRGEKTGQDALSTAANRINVLSR